MGHCIGPAKVRAVCISGRLSIVYDDSYEVARTNLELADDVDSAGTMSIIDCDMHTVFVVMRMVDHPGTVRYASAIAWGRLMAGRPVRIPDATFPWRGIVTGRDMETSVAVLVEVRVMPMMLPVVPVVIAVGAPPFLAVLPVIVIITLTMRPILVVSPFVVTITVSAVLAVFPVVVSMLRVLPILVARPVVVAVALPPFLATFTVVLVLIAVLPILAAISLVIVAAISPVLVIIRALMTLR